jgi:hypothetical protein
MCKPIILLLYGLSVHPKLFRGPLVVRDRSAQGWTKRYQKLKEVIGASVLLYLQKYPMVAPEGRCTSSSPIYICVLAAYATDHKRQTDFCGVTALLAERYHL